MKPKTKQNTPVGAVVIDEVTEFLKTFMQARGFGELRPTGTWDVVEPLNNERQQALHVRQADRRVQVLLHTPPRPATGDTLDMTPEWWGVSGTVTDDCTVWVAVDLVGQSLRMYTPHFRKSCADDIREWIGSVHTHFFPSTQPTAAAAG